MEIPEQFKFIKSSNKSIYEAKEINKDQGVYEVQNLTHPNQKGFHFDYEFNEFLRTGAWKIIEETIEPIHHTFADEINHPSHYTNGNIETIEYIIDKLNKEQFEGYVIGNVIKYVSRYKLKGGYKDLKKARWYLDKLIELENI